MIPVLEGEVYITRLGHSTHSQHASHVYLVLPILMLCRSAVDLQELAKRRRSSEGPPTAGRRLASLGDLPFYGFIRDLVEPSKHQGLEEHPYSEPYYDYVDNPLLRHFWGS